MANQSWVSLLNPASPQASGAGAPITTSATTATISPVTGLTSDVAQVQPAGQPYGWYPGLLIRVTARGFVTSTTTATNVTFSLASRVGNSGSTFITLATAGALACTTAITGAPWKLEALIRCTAVATSGNTIDTEGEIYVSQNPATGQTLNTASAGVNLYLPNASGETAAAVDTTQLQGLSMRCITSAAGATVALTQWLVEALD